MKRVFFVDLETTGLDSNENQTVEVAVVEFLQGEILYDKSLHFYIKHKNLNFNVDALVKFGDRIKDRVPGVPVYDSYEAEYIIRDWFKHRQEFTLDKDAKPIRFNVGGKNFGGFDLGFFTKIMPTFTKIIRHRYSDLGNKYEDRDDDELPSLEVCRGRAIKAGVTGRYVGQAVTHTALEDATLSAELYKGWWDGLLGDALNPTWR